MKKVLKLEGHDPIEIYGPGNKILEEFCTYFPGLKVVARGDEILLDGSRDDLAAFQQKFSELIRLRHVKPSLTRFDIESLFDAESSAEPFPANGEGIIVHSTDGKPIRARNKNQQAMVKAYFEDDLVFAVGPAGTGKTYIAIALAVRALKNREIRRRSRT